MNESELKKIEYFDIDPSNLDVDMASNIIMEHGVIVLRGFFKNDIVFKNYYNDIKNLLLLIIEKHNLNIEEKLNVNELITEISKSNRKEIGYLYDLGTRPIKLLSGTKLKCHNSVTSIIKALFNSRLIGYPYNGETLHIFPPGKENFKYNLPMHQDYPYIMQSPDQYTVYANFGRIQEKENGGISIWLGSHKDGVSKAKKLKNGYWVTENREYYQKKYQKIDLSFDFGDLAIFNSLLQHKGIQNRSNCTRIVQLIRYSNLKNKQSIDYSWQSSGGDGNTNSFKN